MRRIRRTGTVPVRLRIEPSLILIAVLSVLILWPASMLVVGVFRTAPLLSPAGEWSITAAWNGLAEAGGIGSAIGSSLWLAGTSTIIATAVGGVFAFLSERTNAPMRSAIAPLMIISFATPLLFQALGFVLATNERSGLVDQGLGLVLGGTPHLGSVASMTGLIMISSVHGAGFAYLFLRGPIRALNAAHHEAARVSGSSRLHTLRRVDIPLLIPALTGVTTVLFVVGIGIFESVLLLSGTSGISVVGTKLYNLLQGPTPPEYAAACLLAIGLVAVIGLALMVQRRLLGRHDHATVAGKGYRFERIELGPWRWIVGAVIALYGATFVLLPAASLLVTSVQPYPGVYHSFSLDWYRRVLADPDILRAARTTLLMAVVGGGVAMILSFAMAYVRVRTRGWRVATIRGLAFLPLAMPGVVVAMAILWALLSFPPTRDLYGTNWILLIASIVVALPFTYHAADAAVSQVSAELEEAARVSGASAFRATVDVVIRLLAPTFLGGWLVGGLVLAGSLQIPLLLSTPNTKTLSVVVEDYYAQRRLGEATALVCLQLGSIVAVLALGRIAVLALRLRRRWPINALRSTEPPIGVSPDD